MNEFRGFLSQFSTNFHEFVHTLFSIHVATTLKVLISMSEVRPLSKHVMKFWDEVNGLIEGEILFFY